MGRLAGFSYAEVARRLRRLGFVFDRQASILPSRFLSVS